MLSVERTATTRPARPRRSTRTFSSSCDLHCALELRLKVGQSRLVLRLLLPTLLRPNDSFAPFITSNLSAAPPSSPRVSWMRDSTDQSSVSRPGLPEHVELDLV